MKGLAQPLRELARYPSAVAGLLIILAFVGISIYTVIAIPYPEAVKLWRGGEVWIENPKNAQPLWANLFNRKNLPKTLVISSQDSLVSKTRTVVSEDMNDITFIFSFEYPYDAFPQEMTIFFTSTYNQKSPFVSIHWITPNGQEIRVADIGIDRRYIYRLSQDDRLQRRLNGLVPHIGLFADPAGEAPVPLQGSYQLHVSAITFEQESDLDARMVLYGQVHGLAGTDHLRRDLMVALLWGTPIALAFGLLAAVGTTLTTMIIAAAGVWLGGWMDEILQRVTEVNLILPVLPILIMVGTFYSRSIWLMLGVVILLNIFGAGIKTYRAVFLQVKESPYIEAARAYGAGNLRIIFFYLIPRIIPLLIPQLVVLIPSFVFLEASLAVIGLGDPVLPTWGKVIQDAYTNGALFGGLYYWVLEPSILLILTGLAFSMVGFAMDRIFNPRLRGL
jgi:peptide/nickel transport system permease protein